MYACPVGLVDPVPVYCTERSLAVPIAVVAALMTAPASSVEFCAAAWSERKVVAATMTASILFMATSF